tara:strand:- start:51 stop:476 length:426 start_codon:yes stop_codon:yes gene_type:complete
MKKGQAEIFGLVIIMVLLIFALIFFVKIQQEDTSNVAVRSNFRANNLLNAIVNLDVEEPNVDNMKDWLRKCNKADKSVDCDNLRTELEAIFEATLLGSEKYHFDIDGSFAPVAKRGTCDVGISASPVRLPGPYTFNLRLCS